MHLNFEEFRKRIPPATEIAELVISRALQGEKGGPEKVKRNFSTLVEELQIEAYEKYKEFERKAWDDIVGQDKHALYGRLAEFDSVFLSLSQSRRARAGSTFEAIIHALFKRLGYPFDEHPILNGVPDFILPSKKHYDKNPSDCIIFTVKRTLRERWRQIVTEETRGLGHFLATIDDTITESQLEQMKRHRIFMVVPQGVKNAETRYKKAPNVTDFEDFFEDYLDPALKRWRKAGVVQ